MRRSLLAILLWLSVPAAAQPGPPDLELWYDRPARQWVEALPVGNGRLGAMVFGGIDRERIQFNESTLWTGRPHRYDRPEAHRRLDEIRRLLFAGEQKKAEEVAQVHFMSTPLRQMAYQAFGDLSLAFPGIDSASVTDYRRSLDLDEAVSTVRFRSGGAAFTREVFANHPDGVIVMRLAADRPGRLDFRVKPVSAHRWAYLRAVGDDAAGKNLQFVQRLPGGFGNRRQEIGLALVALGVWAVRSWERSLLTLVTLVGVWAVFYGVNEIFAAFALREAGKQVERLAG